MHHSTSIAMFSLLNTLLLAAVGGPIHALCPSPLFAPDICRFEILYLFVPPQLQYRNLFSRNILPFVGLLLSSHHQNASAEFIDLPISPLGKHTLHTTTSSSTRVHVPHARLGAIS